MWGTQAHSAVDETVCAEVYKEPLISVKEMNNIHHGWFVRLLKFNAICGIGIALAVLFLVLFHKWLGRNLYFSNLVAILLVTLWNYGLNARFNWSTARRCT